MCDVPVFYATTEGHTRRIADRVATQLRQHGLDSQPMAVTSQDALEIAWNRVRGSCLCASLHRQKHQAEALAFARQHHGELSAVPSAFISVSLSAASKNVDEVQAASQLAEQFAMEAGWTPTSVATVAGCLAYTKYKWLVRLMMRRIALKEGASGDTSQDHEYTDWSQVDRIADELAREVRRRDVIRAEPHALMKTG